jgi:hypothetical protein
MNTDKIHIIKRGGKWAAFKSKGKKAMFINKHREIVFHKATFVSKYIVIHDNNGQVEFIYESN